MKKKAIALSVLSLGVLLLAGCGRQAATTNEEATNTPLNGQEASDQVNPIDQQQPATNTVNEQPTATENQPTATETIDQTAATETASNTPTLTETAPTATETAPSQPAPVQPLQ